MSLELIARCNYFRLGQSDRRLHVTRSLHPDYLTGWHHPEMSYPPFVPAQIAKQYQV